MFILVFDWVCVIEIKATESAQLSKGGYRERKEYTTHCLIIPAIRGVIEHIQLSVCSLCTRKWMAISCEFIRFFFNCTRIVLILYVVYHYVAMEFWNNAKKRMRVCAINLIISVNLRTIISSFHSSNTDICTHSQLTGKSIERNKKKNE